MVRQEQFLDVIDRDLAEQRFHAAIDLRPLPAENVALPNALGRVLARDVVSAVDVPSFDRSNYDGVALNANDTFGAREDSPRRLTLLPEKISTGQVPSTLVRPGEAIAIATGAMLPRGANAVAMVEHVETEGDQLLVRRAVTAGHGIAYAGTDVTSGEIVLRRGDIVTSRESGVLAAIGCATVAVRKRPTVGILSTGDEIIAPGQVMQPGMTFDSNSRIVADAVRENGGQPVELGIVADDLDRLRSSIQAAVESCDMLLLSGGTSKGQGDLCYRAVAELKDTSIVAHGVALKPGKPICLAARRGKAIVILPGFPTSAIFTFHEFVAPIIRRLGGRPVEIRDATKATMSVKVNSEIGRKEYLLVGLVQKTEVADGQESLAAYPMGKGSGSVTTFSRADGFVAIDRHQEIVEQGQTVNVQLLGGDIRAADFVVIGSQCIGLDFLLSRLHEQGFRTKFLAVGSTGGLDAIHRGECDLAGVHLLDPITDTYNKPFLTPDLEFIPGYLREQGILFRRNDTRFEGHSIAEAIQHATADPSCAMVNRNQGSGTRLLIDRLLGGKQPNGYAVQPRNHHAVAAAVAQHRADWGVAIRHVAENHQLGFTFLTDEQFDFVSPKSRGKRPAVVAFRKLIEDREVQAELEAMGLRPQRPTTDPSSP